VRVLLLRVVAPLILATGGVACERGEAPTLTPPTTSAPGGDEGAFQLRPVETIAAPGTTAFDRHEPTCGAHLGSPCTDELLLDPSGLTLESADGTRFVLGSLIVDGGDVSSASAVAVSDDGWVVRVMLDAGGAAAFESATTSAVAAPPPRNQIAVIVDGVLVSAPTVQAPLSSGQVLVADDFTKGQAERLAASLGGP
jgi:preprotein translocase subunit SecD